MIFKKMTIFFKTLLITLFLSVGSKQSFANNSDFKLWLSEFTVVAKQSGVTDKTINTVLKKSKYLPDVIKYDRFQPEFYENTRTYIKKRTSRLKVKKGVSLYKSQKKIINKVEKNFGVEKELLLSLMGIETNFGNYLGKMDIISSLATLSFDKRRSEFFTKELITILKLIDSNKIDASILFGSWAGAFGNFQFMPSTIKRYALDYDKNSIIELKKIDDSFASAANYINKIGWSNEEPCFYKIDLKDNIPNKYLNTSAKKLINKKSVSYFKKYIKGNNLENINEELITAIITPDKDIDPKANNLSPAYLVFNNYELILKWNRSLRFALAVCTLKNKFKNEI